MILCLSISTQYTHPLKFHQHQRPTHSFHQQTKQNHLVESAPAATNNQKQIAPPIPFVTKTPANVINDQRLNDMIQTSVKHLPDIYDCNFPMKYTPPNENTSFRAEAEGFPTESPLNDSRHPLSNPYTYSQMDIRTLFFIFYFQQGTYHQYLAAKELKRLAWRFHTKQKTWFQRSDTPVRTTNEFEQGAHIYFDYADTWQGVVDKNFKFEYEYLEDEI